MIYLGADHGGFELKEKLKGWLREKKIDEVDVGASKLDKDDDFVEYAVAVAERLDHRSQISDRGILICRNGVGVSVVANRHPGVRCVLGFDEEQVRRAREDDDVNCLALPADYLDFDKAKRLVEIMMKTKFSGKERYKRRMAKLEMVSEAMCRHDAEHARSLGSAGGCCGGCGSC